MLKSIYILLFFAFFANLSANDNYVYPFSGDIPKEIYKERRDKIINSLEDNQIFLAFSADFYQTHKFDDNTFRQSSNFYYLTANPHPYSILLLAKNGFVIDGNKVNEVLYIKKQSKNDIIWNAPAINEDFAKQYLGFEKIYKLEEFINHLESNKTNIDEIQLAIYTKADYSKKNGKIAYEADLPILQKFIKDNDTKISVPKEPLTSMREVKDNYEISMIQKAVDISIEAHRNTIRKMKNLNYEYEAEAEMEYMFRFLGAQNTGYNSITGSGINSCFLHYNSNHQEIPKNSLILMDCGAEYNAYTADITRTVPQNGKFSDPQKIIYNLVLNAADSAFYYAKAGNKFNDVDAKAREVITAGLLDLGIISDKNEVNEYFMHGTSHYLGIDVHDPGNFNLLKAGNVITIEPGIYIKENSKCDKKWWNIGVRIEDNILITYSNPINLSQNLERTAEEIESLINSKD